MSWWALAATAADALMRSQSAKDANEQNTQLQREFATMGIRWKVADAKAAGVHPVYALGASTHMPSIAIQPEYQGGLAEMGQEVSRAQAATASAEERRRVQASIDLQNQEQREVIMRDQARKDLELDSRLKTDEVQRQYLASQIARINGQVGPPMPTGATPYPVKPRPVPAMGAYEVEPSKVTSSDPANPGREAGPATPGMKRYNFGGVEVDLPGQQASESLESIPGGGLGAIAAAAYGRLVYGRDKPSDKLLPPGHRWEWSVWRQSWTAVKK